MADIVDQATRSRMMAGITGRNTRPEMFIRRALHALGYRFRLHVRDLPGRPDLVFPKYRAAIFVNGCFWHGHNCHLFRVPGTRPEFWDAKIAGNRLRDARILSELHQRSWRTMTVWECALRGRTSLEPGAVVAAITSWLPSDAVSAEIRGSG